MAINTAAWCFRWTPYRIALVGTRALGGFIADVIGFRRKVALENLSLAFPEKSDAEHRKIFRQTWQHFTRVAMEIARMPRLNLKFVNKWISFQNWHILKEAEQEGKGIIFLSGHFGNWEWLGGGAAVHGCPTSYVVASQTNPYAEEWLNNMRESMGIEITNKRDAVRGVLSALKRKRYLAMLCDQDAGRAGLFVPFFGKMASTPRGPGLFHLKTGVPLIFCTFTVQPDDKYVGDFERLDIPESTSDKMQDELAIMTLVTKRLEDEIRKYPGQYNWLHRRWKTRPEEE